MDKPMPPRLVDPEEGSDILLDKPILLLGRHQECDIQLNSRKVSRRHCCLAQVNDVLLVRDLNSTNGIRINGEKAEEGQLMPGDELAIGNFNFRVFWDGHPDQESGNNSNNDQPPALAILEALDEVDPGESCEHPIALPDPDAKQMPKEDDEDQRDLEESSDKPSMKHHSSIMPDQPPSIILPESIDLAPSDEFPRV